MENSALIFAHLSDIHLGTPGMKGVHDLNSQLRGALEHDLAALRKGVGPVTGMLVTGDIAYSGEMDQYTEAGAWLTKLCEIGGCAENRVWIVPGNHDIQRSVMAGSMFVRDFHKEVRGLPPSQLDDKLAEALTDGVASKGIFDALANYNAFAAKFRCATSAANPFWEKDLSLNDGSILRLRGVNSTLISDARDDDRANRLVLGSAQLSMVRDPGVEYLVLCHHPPEWLLDRDGIEEKFNALVRIQLFGHKHVQTIHKIDENLRLTAGAVHPDRREPGWVPKFNLLSLLVEGSNEQRVLNVDVYSRVWNSTQQEFVADAGAEISGVKRFRLALREWTPRPAIGSVAVPNATSATRAETAVAIAPTVAASSTDDLLRVLVYRFLTLSVLHRIEVLDKLGLLETKEMGSIDVAFYSSAVAKLQVDGRLSECWDVINEVAKNSEKNPFLRTLRRSTNA